MSVNGNAARTALITGASGGIGSATARLLADKGVSLALHYARDRGGARRLADELRARGVDCRLFQADLTRPAAAQRLVADAARTFGALDIVVNNAGAVIGRGHFLDLRASDLLATMTLNAAAPFLIAREAFKLMRGRGGRIINVSSVAAAFGGSARSMHYGMAKAALEAFSRGLAREGAAHGILVNSVRAGVIDTPFHDGSGKDMAKRVSLIPLRRMGRAEDVARMVSHLAGRGGDFITGQVLCVTGGE